MLKLFALLALLCACDVPTSTELQPEPVTEVQEAECQTDLAAGCEIARAECAQKAATIWEYVECPRAAANCFARAGREDLNQAYLCEVYHATELARKQAVPTSSIATWCGYRP